MSKVSEIILVPELVLARVSLSRGAFALIDLESVKLIEGHKWYLAGGSSKGKFLYAYRWRKLSEPPETVVAMHKLLAGASNADLVDHINGDILDNRKANLRKCSKAQNNWNYKMPSTNTSGFKGVCWHVGNRNWCAQIRYQGKLRYLGSFDDASSAKAAYDAAAEKYFGEFARKA